MMLDPARVREALDYDPETGVMVWVNCSKYHKEKNGTVAGTPTPSESGKHYHKIAIDGRKYSRSRLAFAWMTGRWPANCIDHINGNSLDDRWANLREATVTENAWNHKRRRRRLDLPMGVRRLGERFQARIAVNKRMIHLGTYPTPEAAAAAYANARRTHYGEFA